MLTNREYTVLVNEEKYPEEMSVPLDSPFVDERGKIQNLVLTGVQSVASITSKKGTERANHWHSTDYHYAYVVSGKIEYWEQDVERKEPIKKQVFSAGEMFFTPPKRIHKMKFLEDTVFITMAKNVRDHEHHESDVVRVPFEE